MALLGPREMSDLSPQSGPKRLRSASVPDMRAVDVELARRAYFFRRASSITLFSDEPKRS
jgi:hypothetical protein